MAKKPIKSLRDQISDLSTVLDSMQGNEENYDQIWLKRSKMIKKLNSQK